MNPEITKYIAQLPAGQQIIMEEIRQLVHETVPDVKENFKWGCPVFSAQKDFAYLKTTKTYVTLGFMNFEKIEVAKHLLEGTGKSMRHIKIGKREDMDKVLLKKWFASLSK